MSNFPMGYKSPLHFDMCLLPVAHYMTMRGIRVDPKKRLEFRETVHTEWQKYQGYLNGVAGFEVNVNSPKQVIHLLYEELKLPPRRKNKKLTSDEDAIRASMAIAESKMDSATREDTKKKWQRAYICCYCLLKIRGARKLLSSYIDVTLDADGRARTTITVAGTETWRFSHSQTMWDTGLNLATIPRKLREMFTADEGREIGEFDLNRGESWIYSHLAGDEEMMMIHRENHDFHSITGSAISSAFGQHFSLEDLLELLELEERDRNAGSKGYYVRYMGKRTNHASAYRMGPFRGAEVINSESDDTGITVTVAEVKKAQKLWRDRYPGMQPWWSWIEKQLDKNRTLVTPYGRVRQFHDRWGDSLFKEATAFVPQSTSVDYINCGMLKLWQKFCKDGPDGNDWKLEILHQNHDSILVQYDPTYREEVHRVVREALTSTIIVSDIRQRAHEISIPVEGKYGPNWRKLTELKASP